ncbi:hypothetical protein DFH11DRAFT_1616336 [Phellopilus nigrolimitatus]|nr:hypothetical protein DFH11DRAFT_1616336 [Phellopilus nigrolimitatus]
MNHRSSTRSLPLLSAPFRFCPSGCAPRCSERAGAGPHRPRASFWNPSSTSSRPRPSACALSSTSRMDLRDTPRLSSRSPTSCRAYVAFYRLHLSAHSAFFASHEIHIISTRLGVRSATALPCLSDIRSHLLSAVLGAAHAAVSENRARDQQLNDLHQKSHSR